MERIFDALTLVALLSAALFFSDLPRDLTLGGTSVAQLAKLAGIAGCIALMAGLLVLALPLQAEALIRRTVPRAQLADRMVGVIEGVRDGLGVLRSPGRLIKVVLWSLVLWNVNALAFYVAFRAFDISVGYWGALLLQGLLVLGISVPSTPGFFGVFEAVIVAGLGLYGIERDLAFSYAISYHLTSFVPITLLGLWSLTKTPEALRVNKPG